MTNTTKRTACLYYAEITVIYGIHKKTWT